MPFDLKTPDRYKANTERGNNANGVYIGIVKEVEDQSQFMGRLKVWVPEFGGTPDNKKFWYTVSYASPFAGSTPVSENGSDENGKTQQSYGMWMVPPDLENQVLICFVNGDTSRGYWFACVYQQNMNYMVPAIAGGTTTEGKFEPVLEYNKRDPNVKPSDPAHIKRKRFDPLADGLITQGLDAELRRGISTTSARRESPSRVFGFSTPRGNTIHIDDGVIDDKGNPDQVDNEFIRFRTRSGVGITIHETDGFVFIVSKNGKSYLEISDDGINLYTEAKMNLRTTADYNIQSTGNVNIDAGGNINMAASGHIAIGAGKDTNISAGTNLVMGSSGKSSINAGSDLLLTAGGKMGLGSRGENIRQGSSIKDGVEPPVAPLPLEPERHEAPDGAGGSVTGHTIGSALPHRQPYDPAMEQTLQDAMGTGSASVPADVSNRARTLYKLLKARGYSEVQIAAILGSWTQESQLDPTARQKGGNGLGLAQWDDRRAALLAYAKRMNKPWDTYETQLDFFEYEMRTTEKKAGAAFKNATTLPEAMAAMQRYERFGVKGKRDQYANGYFAQLNKSPNGFA